MKCNIFGLKGLPISKIEHPAITICSQGWISSVTERAMNYQFLTYAESKGYDVANMTAQEKDALKQALLSGKFTLGWNPLLVMCLMKLHCVKGKILLDLCDFRSLSGRRSVSNAIDSISGLRWEGISRYDP